jgi:hypothetical protein
MIRRITVAATGTPQITKTIISSSSTKEYNLEKAWKEPAYYQLVQLRPPNEFHFNENHLNFLLKQEENIVGNGIALAPSPYSPTPQEEEIKDAWKYYQCASVELNNLEKMPRALFTRLIDHSVFRISTAGTLVDHLSMLLRDMHLLRYRLTDFEWKLIAMALKNCLVFKSSRILSLLESWGMHEVEQVSFFMQHWIHDLGSNHMVSELIDLFHNLSTNKPNWFMAFGKILSQEIARLIPIDSPKSIILRDLYTSLQDRQICPSNLFVDIFLEWFQLQDTSIQHSMASYLSSFFDGFITNQNTNSVSLLYLLDIAGTYHLFSQADLLWKYAINGNPLHNFTTQPWVYLSIDVCFSRLKILLLQNKEHEATNFFRRLLASLKYPQKKGALIQSQVDESIPVNIHERFLDLALELGCKRCYEEHKRLIEDIGVSRSLNSKYVY